MILELLKFLPKDDISLTKAAERLMVMSDNEYIELAYILRKIIRECYYNTESCEVLFRGLYLAYDDDCEVIAMLSKLISQTPFENKDVAHQYRKEILSKEGGVK